MNDLSWLLYFGDVVHQLGAFLTFILITMGLVLVGLTLGYFFIIDYPEDSPHPQFRVALKRLAPAFLICGLVFNLIPSKQTIYLIAASETGEEVLRSPTAKKAIDAINRYLDKVAQPEEEKEEE